MALRMGKEIDRCPILSAPEGVPTVKVGTDVMLSVEYLQVIGPSERDDVCSIYGYVRVSDTPIDVATAVNLFNRGRDEADEIDLGQFRFLTLSDDASTRPVFGGTGFFVQMKLMEKIGEDFSQDHVLVDVDFEFDDFYKVNRRSFLEFNGDFGFNFAVAYALIFGGVCADVEFTIIKDLAPGGAEEEGSGQPTRKRNHPAIMIIYGNIGATQGITKDQMTGIELFNASWSDPIQADIGTVIELRRKQVVALTGGGCLGIGYTFFDAANDQLITANAVPFCILSEDGYVTAPQHRTYTQQSDDGLVSVTITLVPYKHQSRVEHK